MITSSDVRNEYTASASQTVFNYTYKIYASTDLNVYVTPAGQACSAADLTTAYTVAGVGVEGGGSITLSTPTGSGDLVTIVSAIPANRTTDYQNNGDFRPDTVNDDLDRSISITKQAIDLAQRSLTFSECQQGVSSLTLPAPVAQNYVRWKSDLSGLENIDIAASGNPTDASVVSLTIDATTTNVSAYLNSLDVDDYTDLIALTGGDLIDGRTVNVTNTGISGEGYLRYSVAHGFTSVRGKRVRITDDWYWERDELGYTDVLWYETVFDADIALQTGTINTASIQECIDESDDNTCVFIRSNTGNLAFTDQIVFKGNRLYDFGFNRGSGLALRPNPDAATKAVMVPDRWYESDTALGRPVIFHNLHIYGNQPGTGVAGTGIHGIMLCNFRPILIDPYITTTDGDGIYGPTTMRDTTAITFQAVGMRLVRPRIISITGRAINLDNDAYSDGWMDGLSVNTIGSDAVRIVKGSGWTINNSHSDTVQGSLLVVTTASTLSVDDWYLETYNNTPDGSPAFSVGNIRSDGITINNIRGNVGAGRTGNFFNFSTANSTQPKITVSNVNVEFDDAFSGALNLIGVSTGSSSPCELTVSNVSDSPMDIYDFTGTANVTIRESNNCWNTFSGDANDYPYTPGENVVASNLDLESNLKAVTFSATGGPLSAEYRTQAETASTANYSETFPVIVNAQKGGACTITITSHDFFNQSNRGQWVGRAIWSQDLLTETPAVVTAELYAATGTLVAPTITLVNIGTANNNDYELSVVGTNSTANARTTVIFSP